MLPETTSVPADEKPVETFSSILFDDPDDVESASPAPRPGQAVSMSDLQLNQIIANVVAGREQYDLTPYFNRPMETIAGIEFRHQIVVDLERPRIRETINTFAHGLQEMRRNLKQAQDLRDPYQRQGVFAIAVDTYCSAVEVLSKDFSDANPASPGLHAFASYVSVLASSTEFAALVAETRSVMERLGAVRYCFQIKGSRVTVSRYAGQPDQAAEVKQIFSRFEQRGIIGKEDKSRRHVDMDHVEAMIIERVARLFPGAFEALAHFFNDRQDFADTLVLRFDREVQFYLAYLDHIAPLVESGLHFCIPTVSASKDLDVSNTFDLALAHSLAAERKTVVTNDFRLHWPERIFVVSGPNQGGKTTFARTVGQLHYLASLGLPVPGTRGELFLPEHIFTHFERGENTEDLRGKLMDDLVRIHDIFQLATPDSLVILNEIFTSTTLADAANLGRKILGSFTTMGLVCVCVTFVDELASLNRATVSMVSTVDVNNPIQRTFKVVRKPADGQAYAMALAQKYHLTHDQLTERMTP